jgi:hypothetical protein
MGFAQKKARAARHADQRAYLIAWPRFGNVGSNRDARGAKIDLDAT